MLNSLYNLKSRIVGEFKKYFDSGASKQEIATFYKGVYLPNTRSNEALSENSDYIHSALELVAELEKAEKIREGISILDFGCGQGRLANGLIMRKVSGIDYIGIDTHLGSINWCKNWIHSKKVTLSFVHLAAKNTRYNPNAVMLQSLPSGVNGIDCIFLNSVFSHMLIADIIFYLEEFAKVLEPNGSIYFTAFLDENVAPVTENPDNYYGRKSKGALHRVVYEKNYFLKTLEACGYTVTRFEYQGIKRTLQSVVIMRLN